MDDLIRRVNARTIHDVVNARGRALANILVVELDPPFEGHRFCEPSEHPCGPMTTKSSSTTSSLNWMSKAAEIVWLSLTTPQMVLDSTEVLLTLGSISDCLDPGATILPCMLRCDGNEACVNPDSLNSAASHSLIVLLNSGPQSLNSSPSASVRLGH
jgi:hypothetical protein